LANLQTAVNPVHLGKMQFFSVTGMGEHSLLDNIVLSRTVLFINTLRF
jgi:hypothetical protein